MYKDKDKLPLKFISLLIALLLFFSVNDTFTNFFTQGSVTNATTTWIRDVPIEVNYDKEKYYILGIPDTVDIKLSGPASKVQKELLDRKFRVRVDFSKMSVGDDQTVKVEIIDLDSSLTAVSDPELLSVSVRDRVTKEFNIVPAIKSERLLTGYSIKYTTLANTKVKISGAEESINNIYEVRAESDSKKKISGNTTEEVKLVAYDRNFNKIEDIDMERTTTTITFTLETIEKTMDVTVNQIGELSGEYKLDSIKIEPSTVVVRADDYDTLDSIDKVYIDINLSELTQETTELKDIKVYTKTTGSHTIESSTVKVTVKLKKNN